MIKQLLGWWYAYMREIDIRILWPAIKQRASSLEHARGAFAVHAHYDSAWLVLDEDEIYRIINELK